MQGASSVEFGRLLKFVAQQQAMDGLFAQLLLGASRHVELVLANNAKARKRDFGVMVSLKFAEEQQWSASMHEKLVRYISACQAAFGGALVCGMPTDKGSGVEGQSLQNSLVTIGDGSRFCAPPQVTSSLVGGCCYCCSCLLLQMFFIVCAVVGVVVVVVAELSTFDDVVVCCCKCSWVFVMLFHFLVVDAAVGVCCFMCACMYV